MLFKSLLLIGAFLTLCQAHATHYDVDRNITCLGPNTPAIFSYHIHVIYWVKSTSSVREAFHLRNSFIEHFNSSLMLPDCGFSLFHNEGMCMYPLGESFGTFGPW